MTIAGLAPFYPWIKALHIFSVITWIAGMAGLPWLFAWHSAMPPGSPADDWFRARERHLLRRVVNPAMIATWSFGTLLVLTPGIIAWDAGWWHVKLAAVILLSALHGEFSRWRRAFDKGRNTRSPGFYQAVSGAVLCLVAIAVAMVIIRPF